jgi:hypothetical protein
MRILVQPKAEYISALFLLVHIPAKEILKYVRNQKLMPLKLVLIPCSQRHNPNCVWSFKINGNPALWLLQWEMLIRSPVPDSLAEDLLPEEASTSKPFHNKFLLNINVFVFKENFFPNIFNFRIWISLYWMEGHAVAQWLRHYTTNRQVAGSILDGVNGSFSLTSSFRPPYDPGVDSASNRNEYQE